VTDDSALRCSSSRLDEAGAGVDDHITRFGFVGDRIESDAVGRPALRCISTRCSTTSSAPPGDQVR
jgi:hypothetical protein